MSNTLSKINIIGAGVALSLFSGIGSVTVQKYENISHDELIQGKPIAEETVSFNQKQMSALSKEEQIQAKQFILVKNLSSSDVLTDFSKIKNPYALMGIAANKKATSADLENVFDVSAKMAIKGDLPVKQLSKIQFLLTKNKNTSDKILEKINPSQDNSSKIPSLLTMNDNKEEPTLSQGQTL